MFEWLFKKIRCMMVGKCHARIPSIQQMFNFLARCILFTPLLVGGTIFMIGVFFVFMLIIAVSGLVGLFSYTLGKKVWFSFMDFMDNFDPNWGISIDAYFEWVIAKFPIKTA